VALTLSSWGFWSDVGTGNAFAFSFVAGVFALRGSRVGGLAYLALLMLVPRPVLLPLAVWLLWQNPSLRWPAAGIFVIHAVAVLATGYADDWMSAASSYAGAPEYDIGPTAWFGQWWLLIGIPLGVILTLRGFVGWAGLAVTPYLLPQFLLTPLWDLAITRRPTKPVGMGESPG
jgi:hypothetical protein